MCFIWCKTLMSKLFCIKKRTSVRTSNQAIVISNEEKIPLSRENITLATSKAVARKDVLQFTLLRVISASSFHIPQYVSIVIESTQLILNIFSKVFLKASNLSHAFGYVLKSCYIQLKIYLFLSILCIFL